MRHSHISISIKKQNVETYGAVTIMVLKDSINHHLTIEELSDPLADGRKNALGYLFESITCLMPLHCVILGCIARNCYTFGTTCS